MESEKDSGMYESEETWLEDKDGGKRKENIDDDVTVEIDVTNVAGVITVVDVNNDDEDDFGDIEYDGHT